MWRKRSAAIIFLFLNAVFNSFAAALSCYRQYLLRYFTFIFLVYIIHLFFISFMALKKKILVRKKFVLCTSLAVPLRDDLYKVPHTCIHIHTFDLVGSWWKGMISWRKCVGFSIIIVTKVVWISKFLLIEARVHIEFVVVKNWNKNLAVPHNSIVLVTDKLISIGVIILLQGAS